MNKAPGAIYISIFLPEIKRFYIAYAKSACSIDSSMVVMHFYNFLQNKGDDGGK